MEFQLWQYMRLAQKQLRGFRRWIGIAVIGLIAAAICASTLWRAGADEGLASLGWIVVGGTVAAIGLALIDGRYAYRDVADVARRIERRYPALRQGLITAVDQLQSGRRKNLGYLQQKVIYEAVQHGHVYRWRDVVPQPRMFLARTAGCMAILIVGLLSARLIATGSPTPPLALPETIASHLVPSGDFEFTIEPGNTSLERGTNLMVLARFKANVPETATVHFTNSLGKTQVLPMNRSLDDPLFGVIIPAVREPSTYRVDFDSVSSDDYRVDVFDFPELVQADAELDFPGYTNLPRRTVTDTRRVTAVEGSLLTWVVRVNKPLAAATLVNAEGEVEPLSVDPARPETYEATVTLKRDQRWKVMLEDHDGRANKVPPELVAKVTPNRPPTIGLTPAQDVRVSAIEELSIGAKIWDDFGLNRYGLAFSIGSQPAEEVILGMGSNAREQQVVDHLIDFESLNAQPDQLLSYYFWAEDTGPDEQPRRISSDMFFAEVRHFEEIFRQGQQPQGESSSSPQSQGGNEITQQADGLIDLQKQIINATWTILRRELGAKSSDELLEDLQLVLESQQSAIEKLDELSQQLTDPQSVDHVATIRTSMSNAAEQLQKEVDAPLSNTLAPAISSEQLSYQGLLKLRAREFEVIRYQRSSSSSSSSSASQNRFQQQLQDLELEDDPDRYETQQQADQQDEQNQAQQELRQILSRISDLARRQSDINKQLQELQTALERAETEEKRELIRRQLKRLREQQEDLLRDVDELNERLEQAKDQPQLDQTRQQLDQSREHLQQINESLDREEISEALATGTRAERSFEEMRDDLRQRTAEQFAQEMRSIRRDVRELDERQQEVSEKLSNNSEQQQPGLRRDGTEDITESLRQQQRDLDELLDRVQQTVVEAEDSQPLLAQKLYEAHRNTSRARTSENLRDASDFLERGLRDQARELESEATQSVQNLRQDVEDAAESVLGDEIESLRRANNELADLMRQIEGEITANTQGDQQQDGQQQDSQQQDGQQQDGQQQGSQQQDGQQQDGQQQDGQQQDGQQQDGQQQDGQQQDGQQQDGQQQDGQQQDGQQQDGQQQDGQQQDGQQQGSQQQGSQSPQRDGGGDLMETVRDSLGGGPITGDNFSSWSDRLREVEEILNDDEMRSQAARIRDRARGFRTDFRRQSEAPHWSLVDEMIVEPMRELKQSVSEELMRRSGERKQLVPVDRDPVPDVFTERVRQYYEALGEGK